jgi:hypothetical protein
MEASWLGAAGVRRVSAPAKGKSSNTEIPKPAHGPKSAAAVENGTRWCIREF